MQLLDRKAILERKDLFLTPLGPDTIFDRYAQEGKILLGPFQNELLWKSPLHPIARPQRQAQTTKIGLDLQVRTKRLTLSAPKIEDAEALFPLIDDDVMKTLGFVRCENVEAYSQWLMSQREQNNPIYILRLNGKPIGSMDFANNSIGYLLGKKYWNRGYMTEALQGMLDVIFSSGLHRLEASHLASNPASGRVMAACGMRPTHSARFRDEKDGFWRHHIYWEITADDVKALRGYGTKRRLPRPDLDALFARAKDQGDTILVCDSAPESWWEEVLLRGGHFYGGDEQVYWLIPQNPIARPNRHTNSEKLDLQNLTLHTDRLTLTSPQERDFKPLWRSLLNPTMAEALSFTPHQTLESYTKSIQALIAKRKGRSFFWAVREKETDDTIGTISYTFDELGYGLAVESWNKGYGREMLKTACDCLFTKGDAVELVACHFCSNPASGRVMAACGMRPTHIAQLHRFRDGQLVHHVCWQLTEEEFKAKNH